MLHHQSRRRATHKSKQQARPVRRQGHAREHQSRSPEITQTLAIQRRGQWTYVLQRHVHAGYPPSIRVGRTQRPPERFHLFTLDDEFVVFPCAHDRDTKARRLFAKVVGSADPAAAWATLYASEGV